MPFIKQEERDTIANGGLAVTPGQLCYVQYKKLIDTWNKSPRWTTIHAEFKYLFDCDDDQAARALAFLVFMAKHGMKYEDDREKENGTI